jgi:assimilatory nitrate reductase catalytic subunit
LVLPAAGWGEKEGTLINSERRLGLVKKVRRAPGQALADFHIFQLIAHYWGCATQFARWSSPEAAFRLMRDISRGQPCDITGITGYEMIDQCGGIQWPWPEAKPGMEQAVIPDQERRLFEDGKFFTPDGKARFLFDAPRPVAEPVDADYPFVLLTGRGTSAQWHTGSRTNKSDVLRRLSPQGCYVEINPADAERLGILPTEEVAIRSRRGLIVAAAFITPTVQPGQVFIPMHYPEMNKLTFPSFDPHSRQPSYKHCAVAVGKVVAG